MSQWKDPIRVPWPKVTEMHRDWLGVASFCIAELRMTDRQIGEMIYPPGDTEMHEIMGRIMRRIMLHEKARRSYRRYFGRRGQ